MSTIYTFLKTAQSTSCIKIRQVYGKQPIPAYPRPDDSFEAALGNSEMVFKNLFLEKTNNY